MADWLGYTLAGFLVAGFGCFVYGYALLIRQAWRSENRKEAFKRIATGTEFHPSLDRRAVNIIYSGAFCGAVAFGGFGIVMACIWLGILPFWCKP